jgi:hypothetical protein
MIYRKTKGKKGIGENEKSYRNKNRKYDNIFFSSSPYPEKCPLLADMTIPRGLDAYTK